MERGDQLLASARQRTDAVRTAAARTGGAQRALGAALASLGGNTSRLAEAGQDAAWERLASEARQEAEAKPEADPRLAAMVRESEVAQVTRTLSLSISLSLTLTLSLSLTLTLTLTLTLPRRCRRGGRTAWAGCSCSCSAGSTRPRRRRRSSPRRSSPSRSS